MHPLTNSQKADRKGGSTLTVRLTFSQSCDSIFRLLLWWLLVTKTLRIAMDKNLDMQRREQEWKCRLPTRALGRDSSDGSETADRERLQLNHWIFRAIWAHQWTMGMWQSWFWLLLSKQLTNWTMVQTVTIQGVPMPHDYRLSQLVRSIGKLWAGNELLAICNNWWNYRIVNWRRGITRV